MKKIMLLALLAIGFIIPGQLDAQSQKAVTQSAVISLGDFQDYDLSANHNRKRSCDDGDKNYKDRRDKEKKKYKDRDNCGKRGKGHAKKKEKAYKKRGCDNCGCSCGRGDDDDDWDDDDDYYGDDDDEYGSETRRERDIRDIIGKRKDDRKYDPSERRDSETKTEQREREIKDILGKRITTILIPGN